MRGWTIIAWCRMRGINPATFYNWQAKNRAPEVTDTGVGGPRITPEADQQWEKHAAFAKSDEARKEAERRTAKAKKAGKLAAKSPLHVSKRGKLELSRLRSRPPQAAE